MSTPGHPHRVTAPHVGVALPLVVARVANDLVDYPLGKRCGEPSDVDLQRSIPGMALGLIQPAKYEEVSIAESRSQTTHTKSRLLSRHIDSNGRKRDAYPKLGEVVGMIFVSNCSEHTRLEYSDAASGPGKSGDGEATLR